MFIQDRLSNGRFPSGGYYEEYVGRLIKRHVFSGNVCLHVEANMGSNTRIMAKGVEATGKVYAFEPHPDYFDHLIQNSKILGLLLPCQKVKFSPPTP